MRLSETEIKHRLVELQNLRTLHTNARKRIVLLEKENHELKQRIKELEENDKNKDQRIEALSFQLEQIKIKLFGKKSTASQIVIKKEKKRREAESYRRPIPTRITEKKYHSIDVCAHCSLELKNKPTRIFFEEDIPLLIQKVVIRHEVETGYCVSCKRQSSGYPIPSKKVILGENARKYICLLSIANRISRDQIQANLKDIFDFDISIGEIGNILQTEADNLRPEYQALKESVIRQGGAHYDETSWPAQKEEQGKYAWVATGTENNDAVFSLGQSRGGGNIEDMKTEKVGISDDYNVYKNAFKEHQLCWAHPHRKLRDLAESEEFKKKKKKQILLTYEQFSNLYHRIQKSILTANSLKN